MRDYKKMKDDAIWFAVVGVLMLFAGSFSTAILAGGVVMVIIGIVRYIFASSKLAKEADVWNDEEIDAWERENF